MKKILAVIHSLKGGGSERVLVNLLRGLNRGEFKVKLVLYEGVFDFAVPAEAEHEILNIPAGTNVFALAAGFLRKIVSLRRIIRRENPDIVFSLLSSTNVTVILAKLFAGRGCRVIVSEHTHPTVNLGNEKYGGITKTFMKYCYPRADRVVAVSGGIRDDLVNELHISPSKITVVYNPVDIHETEELGREHPDHAWFRSDIPIIISAGRLTKQKGYEYLLRAFSQVRKSLPCRLMIIGEGEDREKLLKIVRELHLEDEVAFPGFQKNPFQYMARSSLFVLSSLYEGFGNVLVEAMALGLPVVSTDCPSGPSEIIEQGKSGMLVPVRDENALASAILEVLTDKGLSARLSESAKVRAQAFSLGKAVESYRSVFNEDTASAL